MFAPWYRRICYTVLAIGTAGCNSQTPLGSVNVDGAAPIPFEASTTPPPYDAALFTAANGIKPNNAEYARNNLVSFYIKESEGLCSSYIQGLTRVSRDNNLIFGTLATTLSTLGAAFTEASVVRPLSAAAGVASGIRTQIDAAVFANKTADLIAAGIVNSRVRLYNDMVENKFPQSVQVWPLELALADVQNYHSKCSLYGGLLEATASVAIAPVNAPNHNDPSTPAARPSGPTSSANALNTTPPAANTTPPAARLPAPPAPAARPLVKSASDFLTSFASYVDNDASNDDLKKMMTALKIPPDTTAKRNRALLRVYVYNLVRGSSDSTAAIQLIKDNVKDVHQF